MKQKDVVFALLAVVILMAAIYLGYTQLAPKKSAASEGVQVEVIGIIPGELDPKGMAAINDAAKTVNYNPPVDLSGLNNPAPFGN